MRTAPPARIAAIEDDSLFASPARRIVEHKYLGFTGFP